MINYKSSIRDVGNVVNQIIHFTNGEKRTIEGVITDKVKQGQFTHMELEDGRTVFINDKNVLMVEVFKVK